METLKTICLIIPAVFMGIIGGILIGLVVLALIVVTIYRNYFKIPGFKKIRTIYYSGSGKGKVEIAKSALYERDLLDGNVMIEN